MKEYLNNQLRATLKIQLELEDQKRWNEEVAPCDKLEESIRDILFAINTNPDIRTLSSTKMERGIGNISYLHACFSRTIERKINDEIIPHFIRTYNRPAEFLQEFNIKVAAIFTGGINHSKNYLHLQTFSLIVNSNDPEVHDQFWNDIKSRLS